MEQRTTWIAERVRSLGEQLHGVKSVTSSTSTGVSSSPPPLKPLPPIRSSTSLSIHQPQPVLSQQSAPNPWTVTDPAIKQLSPYRRGPRASFFKNAHPKASQLPDIVGKQFGVPVTRKNNRDSKKVKRVTIADEPESYDKSPNIAMKEDMTIGKSKDLEPALEFKNAPADVLRTADILTDSTVTSEKKRRSVGGPESTADMNVVSPLQQNSALTSTTIDDTGTDGAPRSSPENKVKVVGMESDLKLFKQQEEERFKRMNRALTIQQVSPGAESTQQLAVSDEDTEKSQTNATLDNDTLTDRAAGSEQNKPAGNSTKIEVEVPLLGAPGDKSLSPASNELKENTKAEGEKPEVSNGIDQSCSIDELNQLDDDDDADVMEQEVAKVKAKQLEKSRAHMQELLPFVDILRGGNADVIKQRSRVVRIFLSSTFSDTKGERNYLARLAYPQLQEWCQQHGLEFQVVDMRWGVTQDAVLDHATSDICLQQISECQRLSRGTNFVTLIGSRYGHQAPPTRIEQFEMETIMEIAQSIGIPGNNLLTEWYALDTNAMPQHYVLQKVSSVRADGQSEFTDDDERKEELEKWNRACAKLLSCLRDAMQRAIAAGLLPPEALYKHQKSVTEMEIDKGILSCDTPKAIVFLRSLDGLEENLSDQVADKFIDLDIDDDGSRVVNVFAKNRIAELCSSVREKLTADCVHEYSIAWASLGVNAKEYQELDEYLKQFCDDFVHSVKAMTERELKEYNIPALVEEIAFHTQFMDKRCATFCGRQAVLDLIRSKLEDLASPSSPIAVYGQSGCGKTSVVSMVAKHVREWLQSESLVVALRFMGTTPMSTRILTMLSSVCTQLCTVYELPVIDDFETAMDLYQHFQDILQQISQSKGRDQPLILLFDSLDQLSPVDGAHFLTWLPKSLPPYVKIVTSTLQHDYSILQTLKKSMPPDATYIHVSDLPDVTIDEFVFVYLEQNDRTLTETQKEEFSKVLADNTHPIYVRLLMDQAKKLTSFDTVDSRCLPLTADMAMGTLFDTLENRFGRVFVSHAFTYLTICDGGMSERELDDALSLDDAVLNEVYEYHDPPIQNSVRLPPLLWARLAYEVEPYLTEHDVDGVTTITWYHMLFQKFCMTRYSSANKYHQTKEQCFQCLRTLFTHDGKVHRTIILRKRKRTILNADRGVVHYPLSPDGKRKLSLLPFILSNSGADMNSEIFCNLEWLLTKIKGTSYSQLKQDFLYAKQANKEAHIVLDTLNMGSSVFSEDINRLPFELIARLPRKHLPDMPNVSALVQQALKFLESQTCSQLIPVAPCLPAPNGILKTTIHGPTDLLEVYSGRFALTRGTLSGFQVWNLDSLEVQHYLCDGPKVESNVTLCNEDSSVAVQSHQTTLNVWDIETGAIIKSMNLFPDAVHSDEKPLHWAIEVFDISKSKTLCVVKVIVPWLFSDNKRLLLCDFDANTVTPFKLGFADNPIPVTKREVITCAQFIKNDSELLVWCNANPSCVLLINTATLETIETIDGFDSWKKPVLKLHHDNFYFHPELPYVVIACRTYNFIVIDLEKRALRNVMEDTAVQGKIADICWNGDEILAVTYMHKSKKSSMIYYDSDCKKVKEHLLRKAHPRILRMLPDSALAAIGYTYLGLVEFWNTLTSTCVYSIKAHSASVNAIIFSPDGHTMYSASENKAVKVWNIRKALEKHLPQRHVPQRCLSAASSVDEFTSRDDDQLSLFRVLKEHESYATEVDTMLVLRDDKHLMTSYGDRPPVLLNLESPDEKIQLEASDNTVGTTVIAESPDGFFVYGLSHFKPVIDDDTEVHVVQVDKWEVATCKLLASSEQLTSPSKDTFGLAVFPKSGNIAVVNRKPTSSELLVLDSATLHVIRTHVITRSVASNWMRISPDDTVAASVNPRNVIVVWLLADSLQEHDVTQSTTASQAQVAHTTTADSKQTKTTDVTQAPTIATSILSLPIRAQFSSTLFINDHDLITGIYQGSIDVTSLTKHTDLQLADSLRVTTDDTRHRGEVWEVKLCDDDRKLVSVSHDRSIKIFQRHSRQLETHIANAHNGRIRCCDVSADGTLIVTGGLDKVIRVCNVATGEVITVNVYEDIYRVEFASDCQKVIAFIHRMGERRLAIFSLHWNDNASEEAICTPEK